MQPDALPLSAARTERLPAHGIEAMPVLEGWELVEVTSDFETALARFVPLAINAEVTPQHQLLLLALPPATCGPEPFEEDDRIDVEGAHAIASATVVGPSTLISMELWLHCGAHSPRSDGGTAADVAKGVARRTLRLLRERMKFAPLDSAPAELRILLRTSKRVATFTVPPFADHADGKCALHVRIEGPAAAADDGGGGSSGATEDRQWAAVAAALSGLGHLEAAVQCPTSGGLCAFLAVPLAPRLHMLGRVETFLRNFHHRLDRCPHRGGIAMTPLDCPARDGSIVIEGSTLPLDAIATLSVKLPAAAGGATCAQGVLLQPAPGSQHGLLVVAHNAAAAAAAAALRPPHMQLSSTSLLQLCDVRAQRTVFVPLRQVPGSRLVVMRRAHPLSARTTSAWRLAAPGGVEGTGGASAAPTSPIDLAFISESRSRAEMVTFVCEELRSSAPRLAHGPLRTTVEAPREGLLAAVLGAPESLRRCCQVRYRIRDLPANPGTALVAVAIGGHDPHNVPWCLSALESFAPLR